MLDVPAISRKTEKGLPEYRDNHPDPRRHDQNDIVLDSD